MEIFSPPDPLTKEELEDMRQQATIDEQLLIQKEMETYTTNRYSVIKGTNEVVNI